jgi:phenylalanyl-tRNA synthetase alpha chain
MFDEIKKIRENCYRELSGATSLEEVARIEIAYLGRKGSVASVFKAMKDLLPDERGRVGKEANILKKDLEQKIKEKKHLCAGSDLTKKQRAAFFDISVPGKKVEVGSQHPLSIAQEEATDIFSSLGFEIAEGPEVETEYHNFDALNIPKNHPARDMWDTFWLDEKQTKERLLLRTHTSPVQIRYMQKHMPPFRIVAPGRCFRYEATDARHEIQFYQLEGLMIGKNISLSNLKAVVEVFLTRYFNKEVKVRFLPSYFPFVEPGVEVEAECFACKEKGHREKCPVCGGAGWFEIMGAGMVHRAVLKEVGISPTEWQGFAFGVGLERLAMLKYNINDIRLFYQSDIRFLSQF